TYDPARMASLDPAPAAPRDPALAATARDTIGSLLDEFHRAAEPPARHLIHRQVTRIFDHHDRPDLATRIGALDDGNAVPDVPEDGAPDVSEGGARNRAPGDQDTAPAP
ncbi:MAG: hypothetical protein WCA46_14265, partial [Actinocatenispora sp.]